MGHGGGGRGEGVAESFADWAPGINSQRHDAPLNLYLHTPFCHHRCSFCPFFQNTTKPGFSERYAEFLCRDLEQKARWVGPSLTTRRISSVFFGGGTPSDLEAGDLARVLETLKRLYPIDTETEITVEGRIWGFSKEKAAAWRAAGANRISIGLQSTNSRLRRSMGRLADRGKIRRTLQHFVDLDFVTIVDLIYGLPNQDVASVVEDVRFLAEETGIDGLDLYALKQFPNSPLAKAVERGSIKSPADIQLRAEMFTAAAEALAQHGFEHFTPQHWRRGQRERSIYNQLAKTSADILPFGSSAGGRLGNVQISGFRTLEDYENAIEAGELGAHCITREAAPGQGFTDAIVAHIQRRMLPPLSQWPNRAAATPLLNNWREAGLIGAPCPDGLPLTPAGCFWFPHLQSLLTMWSTRIASQAA
ncbi:putative heme utilization radical SAM enzyme HutW [Cerasicoccus arenae]|uniref:Putative heme utilization radical SAM enzyme HutW n=2 Tax=Cerasicoccus arenae TaxID=424488 RepID=A0A8J3GFB3_9BACT|nr:putative heme utilization radical SAM enzyme HutW [Cerasicoccus arenae]